MRALIDKKMKKNETYYELKVKPKNADNDDDSRSMRELDDKRRLFYQGNQYLKLSGNEGVSGVGRGGGVFGIFKNNKN